MGKINNFILCLFFIALPCLPLTAQNDSVTVERDSIQPHRWLEEGVDHIVEHLFKPDPEFIADSIIRELDNIPSFGILKDNYIVVGTDLFHKPNSGNSDAKFQISFRQRLTNSVLPFRTYLFISYTQLAYWDVFKESFPFGDINFNPTIGIGKNLVYNNRYLGDLVFQLEHESNGRDQEDSRSWNKVSLYGLFKLTPQWSYFAKVWIPIIDGINNKDLAQYKGFSLMAVNYNRDNKFNVSLILNKRAGKLFNNNVTVNVAYKMFKSENQYLFCEFYNGYGEGLLDYKKFHQRFRVGFVIKPNFIFVY
jgi:phospholipase A1